MATNPSGERRSSDSNSAVEREAAGSDVLAEVANVLSLPVAAPGATAGVAEAALTCGLVVPVLLTVLTLVTTVVDEILDEMADVSIAVEVEIAVVAMAADVVVERLGVSTMGGEDTVAVTPPHLRRE